MNDRMSDNDRKAYWDFVARTAREVEGWPAWKRGDNVQPKSQQQDTAAQAIQSASGTAATDEKREA